MNRQLGFTLVEVLVSFVILSLTVVTSISIYADNLSRIRAIEDRLRNIAAIQSIFATSQDCSDVPGINRGEVTTVPVAGWTQQRAYVCLWQGSGKDVPYSTIIVTRSDP